MLKRIRTLIAGLLLGLGIAACVGPAVADAPPEPVPAACYETRQIVDSTWGSFLYPSLAPDASTDYVAWWNGYVQPLIEDFMIRYSAAADACPFLARP